MQISSISLPITIRIRNFCSDLELYWDMQKKAPKTENELECVQYSKELRKAHIAPWMCHSLRELKITALEKHQILL